MKKKSNCADHCITFALTDDKSKDFRESCGHEHTHICSPCNKVLEVTTDISNSLAEADIEIDLKSEMEHDFDLSCSKLSEWKAHVVRTIKQETTKTELIKTMKNHQALIIIDWAMKYLPHSFKESQQNWFGKQGIR